MFIKFRCQQCGKGLKLPQEMLNKKVKCPNCGFVNRPSLKDNVTGPVHRGQTAGAAPGAAKETLYYVDSSVGQTFGPVPHEQLDAWVQEGRVTGSCVIRTDAGHTCPAVQMYPQLAATAPPPPAAAPPQPSAGLDAGIALPETDPLGQPYQPVSTGQTIPTASNPLGQGGYVANPLGPPVSQPVAQPAAPLQATPGPANWNAAATSPYQSPLARPVPMRSGNKTTRYEFSGGYVAIVTPDVGAIMSKSLELWKSNLGLLLAGTILMTGLPIVVSVVGNIIVKAALQSGSPVIALIPSLLFSLLLFVLQTYLGVGFTKTVLKMGRGEKPTMSDLLDVGSEFGPILGIGILLAVGPLIGMMLLPLPGMWILMLIAFAFFFWPSYYMLIDHLVPFMDCFQASAVLVTRNAVNTILLALISIGISIAGIFALCIGALFAAPLVATIWGVAYLMMAGQIPAK